MKHDSVVTCVQERVYILLAGAQDRGSPRLSSSVTVFVNVLPTNSHAPVFDPSTYSVMLWNNVTAGTTVTVIHATDVDTGMTCDMII